MTSERLGTARRAAAPGAIGPALTAHLRDPMRRASYSLILGTVLTSALGLLFWALAARALPAATVGLGAATVSAVTFLANVSTLGLRNGMVRFLPGAGQATRRLVLTSYAVCSATAVLAALVFLLGQPLWAGKLAFLNATAWAGAAFVAATAVWVVFVLQDQVLLGLRHAGWVPVANGLTSVAKIILLPLLVSIGTWAVIGASVLPAAVAVVAVGALVLRLTAAPVLPTSSRRVPVVKLVRFAAADHVTALLWLATSDLLTLLVLHTSGAEASAYYFMASMMGYSLYLVVSNIGSALVAEAARYPDRAAVLTRAALRNAARLVLPLTVLGMLAAPLVLRVLGRDYATNGTVLLQLLLASAVPQIVVGLALSAARLRHDYRTILTIYAAMAAGTFGGSWALIGRWDLPGVGVAILATQTAVALALLASGRSGLDLGSDGLRTRIERIPSALRLRRSRRAARRLLGPALQACGLPPADTSHCLLTSTSDVVVVALDRPQPPLILKIATSAAASRGLHQHAETVEWLHQRGPADVGALLPQIVRRAVVGGEQVVLETRLPGAVEPTAVPAADLTRSAFRTVGALHALTAAPATVDGLLLNAWVDEPLQSLRRLPALAREGSALDRLAGTLAQAWTGREVTTSLIHGDFWPGNVLAEPSEPGWRVTGIVDWENARRGALPDVDLVHWLLSTRPLELGAAVTASLQAPETLSAELAALDVALPNPDLALEHVVLLAWLWHVSAGLERATENRLGRVWLTRNVVPVVRIFRLDRPLIVAASRS